MADLKKISGFHIEHKADMTLVVREVEDISRYGSVKLDNDNRIVGFSEKNMDTGKWFVNLGKLLKYKYSKVKKDSITDLVNI